MIVKLLEENKTSLSGVDAVVGRGGGLLSMEGGTYEIDDLVLKHSQRGANGVQHPAILGPRLAREFADLYHTKAYVVNPPDVDELQDLARMTGIKGVYRVIHLHALNLKEVAIRHAALLGKTYEDCRFIVCHIGGGISVSAHRAGRMIDGFDIVGGEGPMAPTRCGSVAVADLLSTVRKVITRGEASLHRKRRICKPYRKFGCSGAEPEGTKWRSLCKASLGYHDLSDCQSHRFHGSCASRKN